MIKSHQNDSMYYVTYNKKDNELTKDINNCSKRSEGGISSQVSSIPSLQDQSFRSLFCIIIIKLTNNKSQRKYSISIATHTAKSSSKRGVCLTAGTGLDVSHSSRHKLPII